MPPKIVRLVLSARDIDETMNLTMYNVVREAFGAAVRIVAKGGMIGIEYQAHKTAAKKYEAIATLGDLFLWKDSINQISLIKKTIPLEQPQADHG